jgi:Bacteriophage tail sheath protein
MAATTFKHGAYAQTIPTQQRLLILADSHVPVVVGKWPVHRIIGGAENVNKVYLCLNPGETRAKFGYDDDWSVWTGCEFWYASFVQFNQWNHPAPIFVNVFDPAIHFVAVNPTSITAVVSGGVTTLTITKATADVFIESVVVKHEDQTTLVNGIDYVCGYAENGDFIITILEAAPDTSYLVSYNKVSFTSFTNADIIGGTDEHNNNSGLSCIEDCFPQLGVIPGILCAPGYSDSAEIGAAMDARVQNVNGKFKACCALDIDAAIAISTDLVVTAKQTNSYVDYRMDVCWPLLGSGSSAEGELLYVFHFSTMWAILKGVVTQNSLQGNGIPYWSGSNNLLPVNQALLDNGKQKLIRDNDANYLNSQGIITTTFYQGGWYAWGNRTAAYPLDNDVIKVFSAVRDMLDWMCNTIVLTCRPFVDNPANPRLIESVTLTLQVWLQSLASAGALLGSPLIEFRQQDNSTDAMMNGRYVFHLLVTPPIPAEDLEFNLEFDVTGLNSLFGSLQGSATIGTPSGGGAIVS